MAVAAECLVIVVVIEFATVTAVWLDVIDYLTLCVFASAVLSLAMRVLCQLTFA